MIANLDRQTKTWALLTLSDGRVWDVCGDNWAELVLDAKATIELVGLDVTEIVENSECPEGLEAY